MRILKLNLLSILFIGLSLTGCKDQKEEKPTDGEKTQSELTEKSITKEDQNSASKKDTELSMVVANYLDLKDALVADDNEKAQEAGGKLYASLQEFKKVSSEYDKEKEVNEIINDATEQAEHISESPIEHQREHFDFLSEDFIDLLAITGSPEALYKIYCPMYNDNKGANWLSRTKDVKNPYFGSKMINCGEVKKEIK